MRRWVAGGAGALVLAVAPWATAGETRTVGTSAEAWYPTSSLCGVPVGCGSAATTTSYPADTLHVSEQAGQETARTYLGFSSTHPAGTTVRGALLRLPVAGEDAGTNAADTALLKACLVPGGLPATAPAAAPATDCTASSQASYVAGTPAVFEVDLAPLLARHHGELDGLALALLPSGEATGAAVPPTWHLAFSGRHRKAPGAVPISAELQLDVTPVGRPTATPVPAPVVPTQPVSAPVVPPIAPAVAPVTAPLPAVTATSGPEAAPVVAPEQATRLVPRALTIRAGRYGLAWAVPLLMFGLVWAIRVTATRDLRSFAVPRSLG